MKAAARFGWLGPASLFLAVFLLMSCVTHHAAEAKSRRTRAGIAIGAGIIGAIILNEAIKAEQRKHRKQRAEGDTPRRKHRSARRDDDGEPRRSSRKSQSRGKAERTRTAKKQKVPAEPEIETGALNENEAKKALNPGDIDFPVVFHDKRLLRQLGVFIGEYGPRQDSEKHFAAKCYKKFTNSESDEALPDGLYDISLSDEFVAKFEKRGFSLNSLCLAMAGGIRYDPQTGTRLPTFMLADKIRKKDDLDQLALTNEIPLEVPNCFKSGRPYSDCEFSFDPISGDRLDRATTRKFAELGRMIDDHVTKARREGKWAKTCERVIFHDGSEELLQDCKLETDAEGWLQNDGMLTSNITGTGGGVKESWEKQRMIDVSTALPAGYGYSLYMPTGIGGPQSVEPKDLKMANEPSRVQSEAKLPGFLSTLASFSRRLIGLE